MLFLGGAANRLISILRQWVETLFVRGADILGFSRFARRCVPIATVAPPFRAAYAGLKPGATPIGTLPRVGKPFAVLPAFW